MCNPRVLQLRNMTGPEHLPASLSDHCSVVYTETVAENVHGYLDSVSVVTVMYVKVCEADWFTVRL